ncbi:hypothetical protein [Aquirhabdus parva]|nr:hypothetical protein [Aquirhabdus parva]
MKNKLILLFVVQILCLWQCAFADTDNPDVNYLKDKSRIESIVGGFYEGRFSDGTPFQMTLYYSKEDEKYSSYQYPRQLKGEAIGIRQSSFQGDSFTLSVIADDPNTEGKVLYKEEFVGTLSNDKKNASGIWTHTANQKKKTLNFSMQQISVYKEISVTHKSIYASRPLESYEVGFIDPTRPFKFSAVFPVFNDEKIDKRNLEDAAICDHDQECSNGIYILGYYNNLLSLSSEFWWYDAGSAHGHYSSLTRHYIWASGISQEVFLDHFLKFSPTCLAMLSNLVRKGLGEISGAKYFKITQQSYKQVKFLPSPLGLQFMFDVEEFGAYGEGTPPSVFLPKESIKQCLTYLPKSK